MPKSPARHQRGRECRHRNYCLANVHQAEVNLFVLGGHQYHFAQHLTSGGTSDSGTGEDSQETNEILDDYVPPSRLTRMERPSPHRFGELVPELEDKYPRMVVGTFRKLGNWCPEGLVARAGTIVLVDTRPFSGVCAFPQVITSHWRETGDLAVLVEDWAKLQDFVVTRRQTNSDLRNQFSGDVERFSGKSTCMPENHIISSTPNNSNAGYFQTNPTYDAPEIKMWRSLRRGIPIESSSSPTLYNAYISEMAGPIGVLDRVFCDLPGMHDHLTMAQASLVHGLTENLQKFDCLIIDAKPDKDREQGVLVFVTNWEVVWAQRSSSHANYINALKVALTHRKFYDAEKMCFEIKASIGDIVDETLLYAAEQIMSDAVSENSFDVSLFFTGYHRCP